MIRSSSMKLTAGLVFAIVAMAAQQANSHCEIPCGIYDDELRISLIDENIDTIEKSMKQIVELSTEPNPNMNQIVRWVQNKEKHADDISHIVTQYFMTQRLKPSQDNYAKKLAILHEIMIHAMKAKQTTDLDHVEKLRSLLAEFEAAYFGPEGHKH